MDEKRELFVEVETNSASTDETVERIVATVKICRWRDGNLIDGFDNSKIDFCQIKFSQFDKNIYIALLTSFRYFKICKNTQKFLNHFLWGFMFSLVDLIYRIYFGFVVSNLAFYKSTQI